MQPCGFLDFVLTLVFVAFLNAYTRCDFFVILDTYFRSHFCIPPRTPPNRGRQVAGGVPGWGRRGLGKESGWGTKPAPSDPALEWFSL